MVLEPPEEPTLLKKKNLFCCTVLRNTGLVVNHKCVQRLMQSMKLKSRIRVSVR
ncbi:transposase [Acinetobacter baumannii]|nr:transposase [Acinetobacter haemolyticus]TKV52550.1 transposase [Acinetobacter baumannii]TKV52708.1 transposase [Acinetobacter baumannii]